MRVPRRRLAVPEDRPNTPARVDAARCSTLEATTRRSTYVRACHIGRRGEEDMTSPSPATHRSRRGSGPDFDGTKDPSHPTAAVRSSRRERAVISVSPVDDHPVRSPAGQFAPLWRGTRTRRETHPHRDSRRRRVLGSLQVDDRGHLELNPAALRGSVWGAAGPVIWVPVSPEQKPPGIVDGPDRGRHAGRRDKASTGLNHGSHRLAGNDMPASSSRSAWRSADCVGVP